MITLSTAEHKEKMKAYIDTLDDDDTAILHLYLIEDTIHIEWSAEFVAEMEQRRKDYKAVKTREFR